MKENPAREGAASWAVFVLFAAYIIISHALIVLFLLYLPLIALSSATRFTITNMGLYYFVSLFNVVWVIFIQWLFRDILNSDASSYEAADSSDLWLSGFAAAEIFSDRTILYSIYLIALIAGQLNEMGITEITNQYVLGLIKTNQHSIVLLISVDRIIASFKKDKLHLKERFQKMLEITFVLRMR